MRSALRTAAARRRPQGDGTTELPPFRRWMPQRRYGGATGGARALAVQRAAEAEALERRQASRGVAGRAGEAAMQTAAHEKQKGRDGLRRDVLKGVQAIELDKVHVYSRFMSIQGAR